MASTSSNIHSRPGQIAEAEGQLLNILNRLGQQKIPELEIEDFFEDLQKQTRSSPDRNFEEQIGVRLLFGILDKLLVQVFNRLSNVSSSFEKSSLEILRVEAENKSLQKEVKGLKLKLKLSDNNSSRATSATHLNDSGAGQNTSKKKKKSPLFQNDVDLTVKNQQVSRSGSRIFSRKASPSPVDFGQSHMEDISYVPDTLQVASPGCRKSTKVTERSSVPDTPEKTQSNIEHCVTPKSKASTELRPSGIIEQCVTPDSKTKKEIPRSPLLSLTENSIVPKKRKLILRSEVLKVNRNKTEKTELSSKTKKSKANTSDDKNIFKEKDDENISNCKKVGKIDPGAQSVIDKISFQQFEDDFSEKRASKKSEHVRKVPSDTDSDFESPNLLKRPKLKTTLDKNIKPIQRDDIKMDKMFEDDSDEEIGVFNSPSEEEEVKVKPQKRKGKSGASKVRSENRWGIEVNFLSQI